jgi:hypothetical protein
VLAYVWSQWRFAPEKLDALRQQLLLPRSPIVSGDRGAAKIQPPLLKVEYLQREEDFLGQSYALGINACLSVGLPDIPQGVNATHILLLVVLVTHTHAVRASQRDWRSGCMCCRRGTTEPRAGI